MLGCNFPPVKKRIGLILSILSVAGICFFTLRPGGYTFTRSWSFYLTAGDAALAELIQNLILFIPLGIGLALAFPLSRRERGSGGEDRRAPLAAVLLGALLSFGVVAATSAQTTPAIARPVFRLSGCAKGVAHRATGDAAEQRRGH